MDQHAAMSELERYTRTLAELQYLLYAKDRRSLLNVLQTMNEVSGPFRGHGIHPAQGSRGRDRTEGEIDTLAHAATDGSSYHDRLHRL